MKLNSATLSILLVLVVVASGCIDSDKNDTDYEVDNIEFEDYEKAVDRHAKVLEDKKFTEKGGFYTSSPKEFIEFSALRDNANKEAKVNYTRKSFPLIDEETEEDRLEMMFENIDGEVKSQVYRTTQKRPEKEFVYSYNKNTSERNKYYSWDFNDYGKSHNTEALGTSFNPVVSYHRGSLIPPGFLYGVKFERIRNITVDNNTSVTVFNATDFNFESDEDLAKFLGSAFSLKEWAYKGKIDGKLVIDENGVIRNYSVKLFSKDTEDYYKANYSLKFTEKEVKKPSWFEKASSDLRN